MKFRNFVPKTIREIYIFFDSGDVNVTLPSDKLLMQCFLRRKIVWDIYHHESSLNFFRLVYSNQSAKACYESWGSGILMHFRNVLNTFSERLFNPARIGIPSRSR